MPELKLCRSEIQIEGPATLGIHSNVAGNQDFTAGHAWISVTTRTETYFFGLWPDGHYAVENHDPECTDVRIGMELQFRSSASRYYALSPTQLFKLNRFLNGPNGWKYTNTCADWASRAVLEVVGGRVSVSDYVVFGTPRELGRQIQLLEKQSPTSLANPRQGEFPDGRGWSFQ